MRDLQGNLKLDKTWQWTSILSRKIGTDECLLHYKNQTEVATWLGSISSPFVRPRSFAPVWEEDKTGLLQTAENQAFHMAGLKIRSLLVLLKRKCTAIGPMHMQLLYSKYNDFSSDLSCLRRMITAYQSNPLKY